MEDAGDDVDHHARHHLAGALALRLRPAAADDGVADRRENASESTDGAGGPDAEADDGDDREAERRAGHALGRVHLRPEFGVAAAHDV